MEAKQNQDLTAGGQTNGCSPGAKDDVSHQSEEQKVFTPLSAWNVYQMIRRAELQMSKTFPTVDSSGAPLPGNIRLKLLLQTIGNEWKQLP